MRGVFETRELSNSVDRLVSRPEASVSESNRGGTQG